MGCSLEPDPNETEARTDVGLVRGHAYSVTKVVKARIETPRVTGEIPMIRVRNPWGNEVEWNGAWSDGSPEWSYIPDEEKEYLGINFEWEVSSFSGAWIQGSSAGGCRNSLETFAMNPQ